MSHPPRKIPPPLPSILANLLLLLTTLTCPAQQQKSGIENIQGIQPFIQSLIDIKSGKRARRSLIIQYGDSHTKADFQTGAARQRFQQDFGASINGGRGVDLYILGVNGMRASKLLEWSDDLFSESVTAYHPDLIILAYGSNEVTDSNWTFESYRRMFALIIRRFRAASPTSSILVIGPPDRLVLENGSWTPAPRMPELIEAQRQAALQEGAAFWDSCAAMGGPGAMGTWHSKSLAQKDRVHLTRSGYELLAARFYNEFARAYNQLTTNYSQPEQPAKQEESPSRTVGRSIRFRKRDDSDTKGAP